MRGAEDSFITGFRLFRPLILLALGGRGNMRGAVRLMLFCCDAAAAVLAPPHIHSRVVFIRHGQSQFNADKRFTGWCDVDLTAAGRAEAAAAADHIISRQLHFDAAFTSELRARCSSALLYGLRLHVSCVPPALLCDPRLHVSSVPHLVCLHRSGTGDRVNSARAHPAA